MTKMTPAQALEEVLNILSEEEGSQVYPAVFRRVQALASRLTEQEQNNAAGQEQTPERAAMQDTEGGLTGITPIPAPAAPSAREVAEKWIWWESGQDGGYFVGPGGRAKAWVQHRSEAIAICKATLPSPQPESAAQKVPEGYVLVPRTFVSNALSLCPYDMRNALYADLSAAPINEERK